MIKFLMDNLDVRKVLERCSRGVVLGRRLPARFGRKKILVSPESCLKFYFPSLEKVDPELLSVVSRYVKPGDAVWDVGANCGLFSFAAAVQVGPGGKVLAIEPDLFSANLLLKSAALPGNKHLNIDILAVAISDSAAIEKLNIVNRGRSANYLQSASGSTQAGGVRCQMTVPVVSLDWLTNFYKMPNFIKIDTEGLEAKILRGAGKIIREARPLIHCEVFSENEPEVTKLFNDNNYMMYDASDPSGKIKPLSRAEANTLAIPKEYRFTE